MINAGPGQIHTLYRRGGRTQHQQRAALGTAVFCHVPRMIFGNILRLVGRFLLFIQNHQAQILQGREDCGAGTDGHPGFSGTQTLPFVVALPRPQRRVEYRDRISELCGETAQQLGGQGNFGHQYDRGTAPVQDLPDEANIDLGLSAAGDPIQQGGGRLAGGGQGG